MLIIHGKATVLTLRGYDQSLVEIEKPMLEVIDKRNGDRRRGMTFVQLNDYLKQRTGNGFKNGSQLKQYLERKAPDLIAVVQRPVNQDWILEENVSRALSILEQRPRQLLIGE